MTSEQNRETPGFFPDCQKWPHAEVDCRGDNAEDHDPSRPVRIPTPIQERIDAIQDRIDAMYDQPDPTDDEREALIALKLVFFSKRMDDGYPSTVIRDNEEAADLVLAAGFHRIVQAEPNPDREAQGMSEAKDYARDTEPSKRAETVDDFMTGWRTADRTRVQGEPTDAAVEAAAVAAYRAGACRGC